MTYYVWIDVSLEYSSVCVMDGAGKIIREQRIASRQTDKQWCFGAPWPRIPARH